MHKSIHLPNEEAQVAFGSQLGLATSQKALIFLQGDLGVGKTTLVRGFLQARGHQGNVKSPTYTLIEPYALASGDCYHLDLYRLSDGEELEYLGLREMLAEQAVLLVEWPQRGEGWLPPADLLLSLRHAEVGRWGNLLPQTSIGESIFRKLSVKLSSSR